MRTRTMSTIAGTLACLFLAVMAGCASTGGEKPVPPPVQQIPIFPPQSVMQNSDYATFKAENEEALRSCKEPGKCAAALFNISFIYSYSKSPYYDPARGLLCLEDLIKGVPDSPWAFQARVWIDLMKKGAHKTVKKRSTKEEAKAKAEAAATTRQTEIPQEGVISVQAENQQDGLVIEADRQQLEDELRNKEDTIKELNRQLERSRQIDIEIERKQRHLPY